MEKLEEEFLALPRQDRIVARSFVTQEGVLRVEFGAR